MNILTAKEFSDRKMAFLRRHDDWNVDTSPMASDGTYHKTYICSDGATWIECLGPVWEKATAEVEVKGVKVKIVEDVKLFRVEAWSTDDANSVFYYEKY